MQSLMITSGLASATLALLGIVAMYALGASTLVAYLAPGCAGSGIPEAKSYLNGNAVGDVFEPTHFFVRVAGIVLATSAGFPVGREGPMVCIGGFVGIAVVHWIARKHLK